METRIAKKSRFQIVKLEERIAPAAASGAGAWANATGALAAVIVPYTQAAAYSSSVGSFSVAYGGAVAISLG